MQKHGCMWVLHPASPHRWRACNAPPLPQGFAWYVQAMWYARNSSVPTCVCLMLPVLHRSHVRNSVKSCCVHLACISACRAIFAGQDVCGSTRMAALSSAAAKMQRCAYGTSIDGSAWPCLRYADAINIGMVAMPTRYCQSDTAFKLLVQTGLLPSPLLHPPS